MNHRTGAQHREGFSLIGIVVILAVVAILAGAIGPMVFRQMMVARERATRAEMAALQDGLVAFFDDVGRFPTEAEGLAALVADPGVAGWQGPYLVTENEEPVAQVTTDAWNLDYAYDLAPATLPAGAAAVLIASGGQDRRIDAGTVGTAWSVAAPGDDLLGLVTADRVNREKQDAARVEQERLAAAAQAYFQDHAAYPATPAELSDGYLDQGIGSDALFDQWQRGYVLTPDNAAVPPGFTISSVGADGVAGGGDDVVLSIDSVIPGRRTSYYELAVVQAAVDANPTAGLTGDWPADLPLFGLTAVLDRDGWDNPYEERMSTRTILSAGPDADYFTPADNIPPGVVPDDVAAGPAALEYLPGSGATINHQCDGVVFGVTNTSGSAVTLTSLTVTWTGPAAWYRQVKIGGIVVVDQSGPQIGSGEVGNFLSPLNVLPGQTVTVEIVSFRANPWAGGPKVDMGGTVFVVDFSDGSSITFNGGSC